MKNRAQYNSNVIILNDKRLEKRRRPRPRYGNEIQTIIDDLHRLRIFWDEWAKENNLNRYFEMRTYEVEQQHRIYADRTPTSINCLVKTLRQLTRPAIVLHFPQQGAFIDL